MTELEEAVSAYAVIKARGLASLSTLLKMRKVVEAARVAYEDVRDCHAALERDLVEAEHICDVKEREAEGISDGDPDHYPLWDVRLKGA